MKKILSLVLALLMTISCASIALAAEEAEAIAEEPAAAAEAGPYDEAVSFLEANGILKGRDNHDLALESPIKRYEMSIFVSRLLTGWLDDAVWKEDYNKDYSAFDDLDGSGAVNYYGAIRYAEEKGIIQGYGDKKFGPEDGIIYQDALTMLVRALGYAPQTYPWGYIETAINLGLTAGIEGVAWTQELVRGEVAQILYNALFITTKAGDTLASRIWGVDIGWKTVVITASKAIAIDEETATTKGGKLSFQIIDPKTGKLEGKNYTVDIKAFGLEDDAAAAKKVGVPYKAFFTSTEDGLDTIESYKELPTKTIWNGNGEYNVTAFLDGKSLKSIYDIGDTYLGTSKGETVIIVRSAVPGTIEYTKDSDLHLYAFDWTTGDILKLTGAKKKDDTDLTKTSVALETETKSPYKDYIYEVEWIYNEYNDMYFKYKVDTTTGKILGIEWLTPAKAAEMVGKKLEVTVTAKGLPFLTKAPEKSAYASLDLYDLNEDGAIDEYGLYEEYGLGYYTVDKDGNWTVKTPDSTNISTYEKITGEKFKGKTWTGKGGITLIDALQADITEPADGSYIIYDYIEQTKELKIVKVIDQVNDEKNYVGTGVLRAYDVNSGKVVISTAITPVTAAAANTDTPLSFGYAELKNCKLQTAKKGTAAAYVLYEFFGSMYNQYVKYAVCDGKLVDIMPITKGAEASLIAIDNYAGISDDGTVVVLGYNAYKGAETYGFWRLGTIDGWSAGDYFFYGTTPTAPVLEVTSYDEATDTYFVKSFDGYKDKDNQIYVEWEGPNVKAEWLGKTDYPNKGDITKLAADKHGIKMRSSDKYVIVVGDAGLFTPAVVYYEGKLEKYWRIDGYKIGDNMYYVEHWYDFYGFDKNDYIPEFVTFEAWNNSAAGYDAWAKETDIVNTNWYLLGASTKLATCRNILTPDTYGDYIVLNDLVSGGKLVNGKVYVARNGFIVGQVDPFSIDFLVNRLIDVAAHGGYSYYDIVKDLAPTYVTIDFKKDYLETDDSKGIKAFSKEVMSHDEDIAKKYKQDGSIEVHEYSNLVGSLTVYLVDSEKLTVTKITKDNFKDKLGDCSKIPFYYVLDKEGGACTVYILTSKLEKVTTTETTLKLEGTTGTVTVTVKATTTGTSTTYELTKAVFGEDETSTLGGSYPDYTATGANGSYAQINIKDGTPTVKGTDYLFAKKVGSVDIIDTTNNDYLAAVITVTATINKDGNAQGTPKAKVVVNDAKEEPTTVYESDGHGGFISYTGPTKIVVTPKDPADLTLGGSANPYTYTVTYQYNGSGKTVSGNLTITKDSVTAS